MCVKEKETVVSLLVPDMWESHAAPNTDDFVDHKRHISSLHCHLWSDATCGSQDSPIKLGTKSKMFSSAICRPDVFVPPSGCSNPGWVETDSTTPSHLELWREGGSRTSAWPSATFKMTGWMNEVYFTCHLLKTWPSGLVQLHSVATVENKMKHDNVVQNWNLKNSVQTRQPIRDDTEQQ